MPNPSGIEGISGSTESPSPTNDVLSPMNPPFSREDSMPSESFGKMLKEDSSEASSKRTESDEDAEIPEAGSGGGGTNAMRSEEYPENEVVRVIA